MADRAPRKRSGAAPRKRGRRAAPPPSRWRRALKAAAMGALVAGIVIAVAIAGYLLYLDRTITQTFEGRRWSVPAVIYAQPLELYPGAPLSLADVSRELQRLGYQPSDRLEAPGAYKRTGTHLDIYLRAFRFMDGQRASQRVQVLFDGPNVADVRDRGGRPVPLTRLDPATIGSFFPSHGEDRLVLTPEQVPALLPSALKAVEDHNFDRHAGFDLTGIARAMWVNLRAGAIRQGGSTLTQQLVKSYFLDNRRTLERKLRELAMAVILDARFDKPDILNAYINEIYLGQDGRRAVHGFGLGAQFYFNKPLEELGAHEIATLIAVIRGPTYYNPFRFPERALARRDLVLDKMLAEQLISPEHHQASIERPLGVVRGARIGGTYYPAYMDLVRQQLDALYQEDDLTSRGMRIFTTLQPVVQDAVEMSLTDTLDRLERVRELPDQSLQGAVVVTNVQTGEVVAVAGGRTAGFDGFNRAVSARRPIGSLIKPVVFLTALEQGYHLASLVDDAPVSLTLAGRTWTPQNFDKQVYGSVPLVRALGDSLNLATVRLGLAVGVDRVAERLGELTGHAPENRYPSLLLGAEAMTPLQVAGLYGTFASGGFYMAPKSVIAVLDETGKPISRYPLELDQRIASDAAQALGQGLQAVMREGTGRASRFAQTGTAGKTGTSDDFRDSWFAGYDDAHLGVVWLGADDNTPIGLTGAAGALRVWDGIMTHLGVRPLSRPGSDHLQMVEYTSGLLANEDCAEVVEIWLPDEAALRSKPGCGINLRSLSDRLRDWLGTD